MEGKILKKNQKPVNTPDNAEEAGYNNGRRMKTMDRILVIIGITTVAFLAVMIWLFYRFQAVPDTLIGCYFAFIGGECGIMGWIKNVKEKAQERQWRKEDKADEHNDS